MLNQGRTNVHDKDGARYERSTSRRHLKREIFSHPPDSPDLVPTHFHLFPKLKEFLGGKQFENDDEKKK